MNALSRVVWGSLYMIGFFVWPSLVESRARKHFVAGYEAYRFAIERERWLKLKEKARLTRNRIRHKRIADRHTESNQP